MKIILKKHRKNIILAGDFDARSLRWGEYAKEGQRGEEPQNIIEWTWCLNDRSSHAFERGNSTSTPDITFCTEILKVKGF